MHNISSPDTSDAGIERVLAAKGSAPRITPADIEAAISSDHYFTALEGVDGHYMGGVDMTTMTNRVSLGLLTFCVLVLRNGFTVVGQSACASPENFDAEVGRSIARADAVNKIWPLMGYQLRTALADKADAQRLAAHE